MTRASAGVTNVSLLTSNRMRRVVPRAVAIGDVNQLRAIHKAVSRRRDRCISRAIDDMVIDTRGDGERGS